MSELPLSVVMIAHNEEANIERSLKSLPPNCEVILVDSGSEDQTCAIASRLGAKVFTRIFDDYAQQRNYSLKKATRDWIFVLDCDEVLSPHLLDALVRQVSTPNIDPESVAFCVSRRLFFMGRLLRFGKTNDAPLRLFKRGSGEYKGAIHEVFVPFSGKVGKVTEGFLTHYSYKDLQDYFTRFNRYTTLVARNHHAAGRTLSVPAVFFRAVWELFSRVVLKSAWLDGFPGLIFASLSCGYVFVKYLKLHEMNRPSL